MNFKNSFAIVLVLLAITDSSGQEPPHYTRFDSYNTLRLTYADLSRLLLDVQEIVQDAATDTSVIHVDRVSVARESEELTLTGDYEYSAFIEAPQRATSVIYHFQASKHPIESVNIRLGHTMREAQVVGTSALYVKRLSDAIGNDLNKKQTSWIRNGFLSYGEIILQLILILPFFIIVRYPKVHNHAVFKFIGIVLYAIIYKALLAMNLWSVWFPGTAIYRDPPWFLYRVLF